MKFFLLGLSLYIVTPAWARQAVYRLPVDPHEAEVLVKPSRPLPPPQMLSISNLYDGGHFSGERIDFKYNADGTSFQRVSTSKFDYIQEAGFAECAKELTADFIMDHIIHGSVMKHFDNQALDEMVNRDYIDVKKKPDYMEGSHVHDGNQMVYLDTSSVMTAAEIKSYFDGKIPWVRISEIIAPRGMSMEQLKQAAEENGSTLQLRLRRSTLRLVSAQFLDPNYRSFSSYLKLPYIYDGSNYRIDFGKTPLAFEFNRLSQIVGMNREAQQLVAMATAIAFLQTSIVKVYGYPHFPPNETKIVVQALDQDHRKTYETIAGFKQIPGAEDYMMGASIAEAMDQIGRGFRHETLRKLVALRTENKRKSNWVDYLTAFWWIQTHRQSHLRLLDISWNGGSLTHEAPILFRTPPRLARAQTLERVRTGVNDIGPYIDQFMNTLDEIKDFDFHFKWGTRPDDFANRDEVWKLYPDDYLLSGLCDRLAVTDAAYVRKVLSGVMKDLKATWFENSHFIISARSEALRSQLAEFGEPVEGGYRVSYKDLILKLAVDPDGIRNKVQVDWEGFWYRYWVLKHLPGI